MHPHQIGQDNTGPDRRTLHSRVRQPVAGRTRGRQSRHYASGGPQHAPRARRRPLSHGCPRAAVSAALRHRDPRSLAPYELVTARSEVDVDSLDLHRSGLSLRLDELAPGIIALRAGLAAATQADPRWDPQRAVEFARLRRTSAIFPAGGGLAAVERAIFGERRRCRRCGRSTTNTRRGWRVRRRCCTSLPKKLAAAGADIRTAFARSLAADCLHDLRGARGALCPPHARGAHDGSRRIANGPHR